MNLFDVLSLLGGLAMFLYGMDIMGKSLERQAGNRLQSILEKLTSSPLKGFLLGLIVTAIIQSSSATTVMVVGFVNSGLMKLSQACGVIMGANVGTTVTSWILSLSGLEGDSFIVQMLKPTSFTPILATIGIAMHMFDKSGKYKNIGSALLGFAILMFGMDTMSDAVSGLKNEAWFTQMFTLFSNPILGVLAGAVLTAAIQSSSASVGILQALSATGAITFSSAIPIIMGQNIGTCITALISSVGTNKNARRASLVHLYFNIIGVVLFLSLYLIIDGVFSLPFSDMPVNAMGIAIVHTCFNVLATAAMLPFTKQLERLAVLTIRDSADGDEVVRLDERLLKTPAIAVEQCRNVSGDMAVTALNALNTALALCEHYDVKGARAVLEMEDMLDKYEDMLGTYLVKLSSKELPIEESNEVNMLLHMIGDFERIGDHAVNLMEAADEIYQKKLVFSEQAQGELRVLFNAIRDILDMSIRAFRDGDVNTARLVEPLEQVVDDMTKDLKSRHIARLQDGLCTIQLGFVLSDLSTNCERVADHASNIAATLIEAAVGSFDRHDYTENVSDSADFREVYSAFTAKYQLPN